MKNNKKIIKLTSGITALALTMSLMGCGSIKGSKFSFKSGENGEIIVEDDSYIDYDYLDNYYVIEVLNKTTNNKEIYIAKKETRGDGSRFSHPYYEYVNIFNNFTLTYTKKYPIENKCNLHFISEKPLLDYITSYYEIKYRYTYEDMQKIFEIVKEKYVLDNDIQNYNFKTKKRTLI